MAKKYYLDHSLPGFGLRKFWRTWVLAYLGFNTDDDISPKYRDSFRFLVDTNSYDYLSLQSTQSAMASKVLERKHADFSHMKVKVKPAETIIQYIKTQLASTSTSTPECQDDEDLRTYRRCCNCYRHGFCCRPTCFAFDGYASGSGTQCGGDT